MHWIVDAALLLALAAGLFAFLPRLGGLAHDVAALRHARPYLVALSIAAQASSLACYALLYQRVLLSLGVRLRFRRAAEVMLASFTVSHVTPFGSATGTLLNVSTLEAEGIPPALAADGIGVTSLVSATALIGLFGIGLAATAGRHLSDTYVAVAAAALALVVCVLALALLMGSHPDFAERAGRSAGRLARRFRPTVDQDAIGRAFRRLVTLTRSALTGRALWGSLGLAAGDLLFDLLSLDLMFVAFRYQPGFGPLTVAYAAANVASALPLTPGGLGVIEVTLVAVTVGFGAPRAIAVVATLAYRLVNYWLPLPAGAAAYARLRLAKGRCGSGPSPPQPPQQRTSGQSPDGRE
jgi:uncharacterized protein (TIRG00374 family)